MTGIQADISKLSHDLGLSVFAHYGDYVKANRLFEENLFTLLKEQAIETDDARVKRRIRYSGFPMVKTLNTFDVTHDRFPNLNMDSFNDMITCRFIDEKADVTAIGPPGYGKTHIALAIGYEAIKRGYSVRFKRASDLVNEMSEAKTEKKLADYAKTLNRCRLLILDEVGYLPYDSTASSFLFQIISARYETASTFYTTNFEFSRWPQFFPDKSNNEIVTAIVTRIAHQSIVLNMNGPNAWRLEHARSRPNQLLNG